MKKIFAISVLSLLAVVAGGDCAFAVIPETFFTAGRIDQAIRKATNGMLTHEDIISPSETSTSPDYDAPSVSRMENTVNAAVATKVDNEQIVTSAEGQAVSVMGAEVPVSVYSSAVQAGVIETQESMDSEVASVNTVAEHFVPSAPTAFVDDSKGFEETNLVPGQYVMTVIVNSDGTKKYEWQAMELWSSSSTQYD